MDAVLRTAARDDIPALEPLIAASARELGRAFYTPAQIEAALGSAWGIDRQLIDDRTYFAAQRGEEIVACGGWSQRQALFGADRLARAAPALLNPRTEAARIRAFFVHRAPLGKGSEDCCWRAVKVRFLPRGSARPSWSRPCRE